MIPAAKIERGRSRRWHSGKTISRKEHPGQWLTGSSCRDKHLAMISQDKDPPVNIRKISLFPNGSNQALRTLQGK